MLVSISHEVNNSLSVIIGNVQCLIMEKVATSDQSRDRLQRIESAAVKINTINKRLLQVPSLTKHGDKNQDEITIKL
jgi:K+-sensing histidine kinase KdpD